MARSRSITSRLVDVLCGLLAYIGARLIWSSRSVFADLHWELLTFVALYLLLQAAIRGRHLVRAGKNA